MMEMTKEEFEELVDISDMTDENKQAVKTAAEPLFTLQDLVREKGYSHDFFEKSVQLHFDMDSMVKEADEIAGCGPIPKDVEDDLCAKYTAKAVKRACERAGITPPEGIEESMELVFKSHIYDS